VQYGLFRRRVPYGYQVVYPIAYSEWETSTAYPFYIESSEEIPLPQKCCTLSIKPLLRELIVCISEFANDIKLEKHEKNIITVMLNEINRATVEHLFLPTPNEPKLKKLINILSEDPANRESIAGLAKKIGMGERTLARKLMEETSRSFGQWKRQLHIITAIKKLSIGESVKSIAYSLGYESSSSFVTMFKKALGKSPLRYTKENS
jgi:AraC-like DNA-binding protein